MNRLGELSCLLEVRLGRLTPDHVRIGRVGKTARDRLIEAGPGPVETLGSSLTGDELAIAFVRIGSNEVRSIGIRARDKHRRDTRDICGQSCRVEFRNRFVCRHEHLTAHVTALLRR